MRLIGTFVLLGGPALVAAPALGYALRRWGAAAGLFAAGLAAAGVLFYTVPDGGDDDDDPDVLMPIALTMNVLAWGGGLAAGTALGRRRR